MKKVILFCTGEAGSGKSYFIKNHLPNGLFYNLKSATTRPPRKNEQDGKNYYFKNEEYFNSNTFATKLWVNESIWKEGMPKWLYGVPEFEIINNLGKNFTYDVIQPKYVRQMIDWFDERNLNEEYDYKIVYFLPSEDKNEIVQNRANMPYDKRIRKINTCTPLDFLQSNLDIDFLAKRGKCETIVSSKLKNYINDLNRNR